MSTISSISSDSPFAKSDPAATRAKVKLLKKQLEDKKLQLAEKDDIITKKQKEVEVKVGVTILYSM